MAAKPGGGLKAIVAGPLRKNFFCGFPKGRARRGYKGEPGRRCPPLEALREGHTKSGLFGRTWLLQTSFI